MFGYLWQFIGDMMPDGVAKFLRFVTRCIVIAFNSMDDAGQPFTTTQLNPMDSVQGLLVLHTILNGDVKGLFKCLCDKGPVNVQKYQKCGWAEAVKDANASYKQEMTIEGKSCQRRDRGSVTRGGNGGRRNKWMSTGRG